MEHETVTFDPCTEPLQLAEPLMVKLDPDTLPENEVPSLQETVNAHPVCFAVHDVEVQEPERLHVPLPSMEQPAPDPPLLPEEHEAAARRTASREPAITTAFDMRPGYHDRQLRPTAADRLPCPRDRPRSKRKMVWASKSM